MAKVDRQHPPWHQHGRGKELYPSLSPRHLRRGVDALVVDSSTNLTENGPFDDGTHYRVLERSDDESGAVAAAITGAIVMRSNLHNDAVCSWCSPVSVLVTMAPVIMGKTEIIILRHIPIRV